MDKKFYLLIVLHIVLGVAFHFQPALAKIYGVLIILLGFFFIVKYKNANNEVLYVSAYIIGSEVILRMTEGNLVHEYGKYGLFATMILGIFYSGFSKKSLIYCVFIVLLLPSLVIASQTINYDVNIRKSIIFNISGPVSLGISAIYTYNRKVTIDQINKILFAIGLPIVSCTIFLILHTPDIRSVITGTSSNFETSGGFGPNQVSTIMGLGIFIFFSRMLFVSPTKLLLMVNAVLAFNISFRGLMTFSRGGIITGILMVAVLLFSTYQKINSRARIKLYMMLGLFLLAGMSVWLYSSLQTGGLIDKRYSNEDARGRVKESRLSGREDIMASEIRLFMENPIFGVGVSRGVEYRRRETGLTTLSHNEVTRLMAEHGSLGIIAMFLLIIIPFVHYINNKNHIYFFSFFIFWLLTINHAAMRLAAPSFIYALTLLKVTGYETTPIHRKQII